MVNSDKISGETILVDPMLNYYIQQMHGINQIAIVAITDEKGKIKYVNETFCQISGYSSEELIGQDHRVVNSQYHPKDFFKSLWTTIREGKIWRGEIKNRSKNGGYYWVDTSIIPVRNSDGKIFEFLAIRFDITEKKLKDGLFKEIVETNPEGFCILNIEGKIIEANAAYVKISGYTSAELLKMSILDLEAQETAEEIFEHIEKVRRLGYDRFETKHRRKDGSIADLEVSVSYYPVNEGIFTVFMRDISEIKKVMNLLTAEKDRAEKLAEAKARFLSTMSHEIRTPLNGIIGMLRLILESSASAPIASELTRILKTSEGLNGIINDILDYTRIESGKIQIEKTEFRMTELAEAIFILFEMSAKEKKISFEIVIDPTIPQTLVGDSFRIRQVLINLVGNALKFTKVGGVELKIKLLESTEGVNKVQFSVKDTGIGIDPSVLNNLAAPFVQGDCSISRKFGGSGLGLFISKNILNLMDSNFHIKSELGLGTEFEFVLNLESGKSEQKKVTFSAGNYQSLKQIFSVALPDLIHKNLMIVEDDCVNQSVISGYLRVANISHVLVDNGEDCVNLIRKGSPSFDGILMDVHMPVMNGLDATRLIRDIDPNIPIIALTAGVTEGERKLCLNCGMIDILLKPIDPSILVQMLNKYLSKVFNENSRRDVTLRGNED